MFSNLRGQAPEKRGQRSPNRGRNPRKSEMSEEILGESVEDF